MKILIRATCRTEHFKSDPIHHATSVIRTFEMKMFIAFDFFASFVALFPHTNKTGSIF